MVIPLYVIFVNLVEICEKKKEFLQSFKEENISLAERNVYWSFSSRG